MVDRIASAVERGTSISDRYRESASWQSMDAFLVDWHRAQHRLNRQITELTKLRDERRDATERGEWPPPTTSPAEGRVVDLMAALEQSIADARAARDRQNNGSEVQQ